MTDSRPYVASADGLPVYRVQTTARNRFIDGSESCIATVPPEIMIQVGGGPPQPELRALGRLLRELSEGMAKRVGSVLHHAEWVITADPEIVETRGMCGRTCLTCRAGVDQALADLAERGEPLLVGILYWAR